MHNNDKYSAAVTFKKAVCNASVLLVLVALLSACGGSSSGGDGTQVTPATKAFTYYKDAKRILDSKCVACHGEGDNPLTLSAWANVVEYRSAVHYVIESAEMPPPGALALTSGERLLLLDWLESGAQMGDPADEPVYSTDYSYYQHTRDIIERNCSYCHSPGSIAPFPLNNYEQIYNIRAAAAHVIANRSMPPWSPSQGYTPFKHVRALSDEDRYILLDWLRGGAPAGSAVDDQDAVPEPAIAEPDVLLTMTEAYTPNISLGADDYRCFILDWSVDEEVYVTGVDVIPDIVPEVHHVIVSIIEPENVAEFKAGSGLDGRPGYECFGSSALPDTLLFPRQLAAWVPGDLNRDLPEGTGILIKPGSALVMQMHYNTLIVEPTPDQSSLALWYSKSVERAASSMLVTDGNWVVNDGGMLIPANDPHAYHDAIFSNIDVKQKGLTTEERLRNYALYAGKKDIELGPEDAYSLHMAGLHMHSIGKSSRATLLREDGSEQVLIDIQDWDFSWQGAYYFANEVIVQPGDRIHLSCVWDNSADNQPLINGEAREPIDVEWGDGTTEEMCLVGFYTTAAPETLPPVESSLYIAQPEYMQAFAPGDDVPVVLRLNNFHLHEPVAHVHEETTLADQVSESMGMDEHVDSVAPGGDFSGHFHIYLDSDDDAAEHLTAWETAVSFPLPTTIAEGIHELRISLRDDDHQPRGIEQKVTFQVVKAADPQQRALIVPGAWQPVAEADDAFASHRPALIDCPPSSWYLEDSALEIQTGYCNYLTVAQPIRQAVRPGDRLHLVLWHGDLRFAEPATAHVALSIGGKPLWENRVNIPAAANIFDINIEADLYAEPGDMLQFHLHNHGYNTWKLLSLEKQP